MLGQTLKVLNKLCNLLAIHDGVTAGLARCCSPGSKMLLLLEPPSRNGIEIRCLQDKQQIETIKDRLVVLQPVINLGSP
jgi:hypothetical protein